MLSWKGFDKHSNLLGLFLSYKENEPGKLKCCVMLSWKGLLMTNTLTYWALS
jgi:hypothetical protein